MVFITKKAIIRYLENHKEHFLNQKVNFAIIIQEFEDAVEREPDNIELIKLLESRKGLVYHYDSMAKYVDYLIKEVEKA